MKRQGGEDVADAEQVVVATGAGRLQGRRDEHGVGNWLGIPYAAPPVGPLRFRPPQPARPWTGIRPALRFGASAPQPFSLAEQVLGLDAHEPSDEDCLTLNVSSRGPGGPARPVMVWLHGGSFLNGAGSDPLYDGWRLAARGDVVVVTVNYRLGVLGFLHLGGAGGEPEADNLGLRDQIAALAWVRDNIAAFGGDPGCVTLFGQSAGAMAVGALLGAPAARGLFHRAILQSGAAQNVHSRAGADRIAGHVRKALGIAGRDVAALRDLPLQNLVEASVAVAGRVSLLALPFQPVVDGTILPQEPLAAVRAGAAVGVPLLIGTTRDELALYEVIAEQDPTPDWIKQWRRLRAFGEMTLALGPHRLSRIRGSYGRGASGLAGFATDAVFRIPALDLAQAQERHARSYMYRFDWPSPAYGGRLGACHALEVPFVWDSLEKPAAHLLTRDEPATRALAVRMQEAWIAFARTGSPQTAALPDWPRYADPRRATMIFDTACRVEDDPQGEQRRAWA